MKRKNIDAIAYGPRKYWEGIKKSFMYGWNFRF